MVLCTVNSLRSLVDSAHTEGFANDLKSFFSLRFRFGHTR